VREKRTPGSVRGRRVIDVPTATATKNLLEEKCVGQDRPIQTYDKIMGNVIIKTEPIVINISPFGFHRYSKKFLEVALTFQSDDNFSPVPYYLFCRSIELSLKSFLLAKGVSKSSLKQKNLGHNLEKNLEKAQSLGLNDVVTINTSQIVELKKANNYYNSKGFEYFEVIKAVTGYPNLPNLSLLSALASSLVSKLESICKEA